MNIYPNEINDGLEDKIKASASVSYAALAQPVNDTETASKIRANKAIAGIDDSDLYYVQSILVTSSWNKNDDIFDKLEVWQARNTPEDKPTNLDHNEEIIIGHITSNWPITEDGILIDQATPSDNLPDKFHILTGSVIYKGFSNPELKGRSDKLIAEIENGTKYVSMECYFKGFDYGVEDKTSGEYKVIARNEESSHLTKYLRAYGGLGENDNYKIGRVLRQITFSGKGYVDKPANPDSIIFNSLSNEQEKNSDFVKAGVFSDCPNNMENNNMNLEQEIAELKAKVEAAVDCASATKEAYSLATQLKDTVASLEKTIEEKNSGLASLQASYDELVSFTETAKKHSEEENMKKEEMFKKTKSELDEALESIAGYKSKEADMMKKEKKMKRMASLVEMGIDQETATATVDKFENLEDEAFEGIAELLSVAAKKVPPKKEEKPMASEDVLETAETVEATDLSVGGEDNEIETTRAALVDFVRNRLNKKNSNKGE
jgi:hypothetical protein